MEYDVIFGFFPFRWSLLETSFCIAACVCKLLDSRTLSISQMVNTVASGSDLVMGYLNFAGLLFPFMGFGSGYDG